MYSFLQDNDNQFLINNIDKPYNKVKLTNQLQSIPVNNEFIESVYLYNTDLYPLLIKNNGGEMINIYNNSEETVKQFIKEIEKSKDFMVLPASKIIKLNSDSNTFPEDFIAFYMGIHTGNDKTRLLVTISEKNLYNILKNTTISKYGESYILDKTGYVLSSTTPGKRGAQVNNSIFSKIKQITTSDELFRISDKDNLIVVRPSDIFKGYYLTIIPIKNITGTISHTRNIFYLSFLILLVTGLIIALYFSGKNYRPLMAIIDKINDLVTGENMGTDEFSLLSNTFEKITNINQRNRERRLLLSAAKNGKDIKNYQYLISGEVKQVVVIKSFSGEIDTCIQKKLKHNKCDEFEIYSIRDSAKTFILIINSEEIYNHLLKNYLIKLKNEIKEETNSFTVIGIGNKFKEINNIHLSFHNALQAIKQGNCYDELCIFNYKTGKQYHNIYFPLNAQEVIKNILVSGEKDRMIEFINNIFERNKGMPYLYLQIISSEFINVFLTLSKKYKCEININYIYNKVDSIYRADKLQKFIIKLFLELIEAIPDKEKKKKTIMDFVCNYIKNNYSSQSLSIQLLADELDLTPSYLSRRFKHQAGNTFTDYLKKYRMEMAKELLINTDNTIKLISKKVGFGSYSSFVRAFRKMHGITPGEFRKINKQE